MNGFKNLNCLNLLISDFKTFKVYMKTKKFNIWIDQMDDGSYRYASWSKSKTIDDITEDQTWSLEALDGIRDWLEEWSEEERHTRSVSGLLIDE